MLTFLADVLLLSISFAVFDNMNTFASWAMINLDFTFRVRCLDIQSGKNEVFDLTKLLIIHSDQHFNQFIK